MTEPERVFARVILPHNVINNTFEPLFSLAIGKNYSLYNDILNFVWITPLGVKMILPRFFGNTDKYTPQMPERVNMYTYVSIIIIINILDIWSLKIELILSQGIT